MRKMTYLLTLIVGIGIGYLIKQRPQAVMIENQAGSNSPPTETPRAHVELPKIEPSEKKMEKSASSATESPATEDMASDFRKLKEKFDSSMNQDNLDNALRILTDLERVAPSSIQFFEGKGRYLVRNRDYAEAKAALTECLSRFPKSKSCLTDFANVELQMGTKEEKEKAAVSCLSAYPGDPECNNALGIAKMNMGKYEEAVSIYEHLLKTNGDGNLRFDEALLHSQLAYALEGKGSVSEAYQHFERACRINPDFGDPCRQADRLRTRL